MEEPESKGVQGPSRKHPNLNKNNQKGKKKETQAELRTWRMNI